MTYIFKQIISNIRNFVSFHEMTKEKWKFNMMNSENSVEFNQLMGRSLILNNDSHLIFRPDPAEHSQSLVTDFNFRTNGNRISTISINPVHNDLDQRGELPIE